ncbi:MAG: hypothetical protein RR193_02465, partial [Christensenellaceae bacterium]
MGIELPDHETGEMEYWMCFLKDKKLVKSYQNNYDVSVWIDEKSFYCGVDEDGHVRDWIWCFLPETAVFDTVIENGQLLLTPLFPAEE